MKRRRVEISKKIKIEKIPPTPKETELNIEFYKNFYEKYKKIEKIPPMPKEAENWYI